VLGEIRHDTITIVERIAQIDPYTDPFRAHEIGNGVVDRFKDLSDS